MIILLLNEIGSEGASARSEVLKINSTLTELDLNRNTPSPQLLYHCDSIITYEIDNYILEEGAKMIGEALKINLTLTKLDLRGNHIKTKGAFMLSEALKSNTALTELDLSSFFDGNTIYS